MYDREFLKWILARLYLVHGETAELDYMTKLASIIDKTSAEQLSPNIASADRVRELVTYANT